MIFLIVYITGVVVAYVLARSITRKDCSKFDPYSWADVLWNLIVSLVASWLAVISLFILILGEGASQSDSKPPKWL